MKIRRLNSKIAAFALFTAISMTAAPVTAMANDDKNVKTELKFVGNVNDQPVFHLQLNNTLQEEFTIVIRDLYSNVLYRYTSKNGNFDKKFLLNTDEIGDDPLRFEITIGKEKPVVYEINRNSRTIEEVVVNKVQ